MAISYTAVDMPHMNNSEEALPCSKNAMAPMSNSDATKEKRPILDKVLDPKGPILQRWNMTFVVSCVLAVLLDPLFLYIPILNDDMKCIGLDSNLKIAAVVLRSLTDLVYIVKITFQIYKLQKYKEIWDSFILLVDILAVLPIPQVVIIVFFTKMRGSGLNTIIMNFLVLIQYVPRVFCIYLACQKCKIPSCLEKWESWLKGGLSFFMYILASNVFGALWYFFSIQRMMDCWSSACHSRSDHNECKSSAFQCHNQPTIRRITLAYDLCPINPQNATLFDFGIFLNVLQPEIAGSTNYLQKLTNCLLWALRNLSSFGSNLQPSINTWENLFATSVSIIGLLLFLYLIGKLQIYMGWETTMEEQERWTREVQGKKKIELTIRFKPKILSWLDKNHLDHSRFKSKVEAEVVDLALKRNKEDVDENEILPGLSLDLQDEIQSEKDAKDIDSWLKNNDLYPQHFKSKIVEAVKEKRKQDVPFNLGSNNILSAVPDDIRNEIMNSVYMSSARLNQVRLLRTMTKQEYERISKKLNPRKFKKSETIIKEKESLKLIFIVDRVVSIKKRYCSTLWELKAGDIYGEELLHWPSPKATESVKAKTAVEALILDAEALQSVLSEDKLNISKGSTPKFEVNRLSMLKNVPKLKKIDEKVLKAISEVLVPKSYPKGEEIIKAKDKLDKMFLVTSGVVGVRFNKPRRKLYRVGELYGEELVHWALDVLDTGKASSLPLSAGTASTDTTVDVLILTVEDLEKKMKDLADTETQVPLISSDTGSPPPTDSESED